MYTDESENHPKDDSEQSVTQRVQVSVGEIVADRTDTAYHTARNKPKNDGVMWTLLKWSNEQLVKVAMPCFWFRNSVFIVPLYCNLRRLRIFIA